MEKVIPSSNSVQPSSVVGAQTILESSKHIEQHHDDVTTADGTTCAQVNDAMDVQDATATTESSTWQRKAFSRIVNVCKEYDFPILVIIVILLARAYPPLGADYLYPKITATWLAVVIIFLLAGMGLRTQDLAKASQRIYFNSFVQLFNFGFVSIVVYVVSRLLLVANILDAGLADGMAICGCLPMAINAVIVFSTSSGADEAAAVFNSTIGNMLGIFLSPLLILGYLGKASNVSLGEIFYKLTLKVLVPIVFGQILQKFWKQGREFFTKHKWYFKKASEYCLVFIIYTVFCKTFQADAGAGIGQVLLMMLFLFLLMISFFASAWYAIPIFFPNEPELRVMGFMGCVMKTAALGIPLISSMYEGNPKVGLYSLAILIWYPMELVVGSLMIPKLSEYIKAERKRIDWTPEALDNVVRSPQCRDEENSGDLTNTSNTPADSVVQAKNETTHTDATSSE